MLCYQGLGAFAPVAQGAYPMPMKRVAVIAILVLAFCGLADSAYLTQHELSGTPLVCTTGSAVSCTAVVESPYAHILGIPLAEYGILFYGLLFTLAALELVLFDQFMRRLVQGMAVFGVFASIIFSLIQVYVIQAFCVYCAVSTGVTILILLFAAMLEPLSTAFSKEAPTA